MKPYDVTITYSGIITIYANSKEDAKQQVRSLGTVGAVNLANGVLDIDNVEEITE